MNQNYQNFNNRDWRLAMAQEGRNRQDKTHLTIRPFLTSIDSPRVWRSTLIFQEKIEPDSELALLLEQAAAWDFVIQQSCTNPRLSQFTGQILGLAQV